MPRSPAAPPADCREPGALRDGSRRAKTMLDRIPPVWLAAIAGSSAAPGADCLARHALADRAGRARPRVLPAGRDGRRDPKTAPGAATPVPAGGWTQGRGAAAQADNAVRKIARPVNGTRHVRAMACVTDAPMARKVPASDGPQLPLVTSGRDHGATGQLSTRQDDFATRGNAAVPARRPGARACAVPRALPHAVAPGQIARRAEHPAWAAVIQLCVARRFAGSWSRAEARARARP